MAWPLIKELVGASQQKPNRSWARRPRQAPGTAAPAEGTEEGPPEHGWAARLVQKTGDGSLVPARCPRSPGCAIPNVFLPTVFLGHQDSLCSQNQELFH